MKTLLVIGDEKDFDSFQKFCGQRKHLTKYDFYFEKTNYHSLLNGELPDIKTREIVVLFFFPFVYWEDNIETKKSKGVYGNKEYFIKFKKFWKTVSQNIKKFYKNKKIHFVNNPEKIYLERDKKSVRTKLAKKRIPVSKHYLTRDYQKILEMLEDGKKFFIKVRYGSMGKGITYLEKNYWLTNFRFRNKNIISRKSDYGWTFVEITGNKNFLKRLMKQNIVIEEAVKPFLIKRRKFDLRIYVAFGEIIYIYPRSNSYNKIITNISQGGKGEDRYFLNSLPKKLIDQAKKSALKAVKALGLNFAGVDIIPDSDHSIVVIEVNAFPGFPSMKNKKTRFNLSKHIIDKIGGKKW